MTWLRDHKRQRFEQGLDWADSNETDEPDWVIEQTRARRRRDLLRQREEMGARLAQVRAKEKAQKEKFLRGETFTKKRKLDGNGEDRIEDENQFVLDDYESDQESKPRSDDVTGLSAETLALMGKLGMNYGQKAEDEDSFEEEVKVRRLTCCSDIFD